MTKDERIALLLMDDAHWKAFKMRAESYYTNHGEAPLVCFREMPAITWSKYEAQLEVLRVEQRPAIEKRRKDIAAAKRKQRKAVYMKDYMVFWRRKQKMQRSEHIP